MESSLFPFLDPGLLAVVFFVLLGLLETLRDRLKGFLPGVALVAGALLGRGGVGLFTPGDDILWLIPAGGLLLWFHLGLESGGTIPQKRRSATLTFGLLTSLLGAGAAGAFCLFLGWDPLWSGAAALLVLARGAVPPEFQGETRLQTRGTPIAAGAASFLGYVVLAGALGLLLFAAGKGTSPLQLLPPLLGVLAAGLVLPPVLRPVLRRFSEDSPWMGLLLMAFSLGLGYLGQMFLGVPPEVGVFLAGAGIGRVTPPASGLKKNIGTGVHQGILLPLLLLLGTTIDLKLYLSSWEVWVLGLLMGAAFLGAPLIASGFLRIWYAYSGEETLHTGFLLVYPGVLGTAALALVFQIAPGPLVPAVLAFCLSGLLGPWGAVMLSRSLMKKGSTGSDLLGSQGRRIMVSLSNPDTAPHLVELALALHPQENDEPLFPAIVIPDGPDTEKGVVKAERMLAVAMARVEALGISVVPVTSIDVNITSGLARVSRARRISLMILGWNGQYSVQRSIFGSVLDQTIKTSRLELFVLKSAGTLNGVGRLQVGLPPLVETQQGFDQALADLLLLGGRLGCGWVFYGVENTLRHIEDRVRSWRTPGEKSFEVLNDWKLLLDRWKSRLGASDMLVLFSLRQNQLAWQPSLDRWPRQVAQSFPDHPFLVIYPREGADQNNEDDEAFEAGLRREAAEDLPKIILHMEGTDVDSALRQLLQIDFYGETLEKTSLILGETAKTQPVELKPGVVLVHAHLNIVDDFAVYWGVNRQGWTLPELGQEVKILVILISPLAEGPEMHLRKLAELARLIGRSDWTEELLRSSSLDDLLKKIPKYRP